jgi:hypothetical protein
MRGVLVFLVFAATLIALLVFVAGPVVARPLAVDAVRAAIPGDDPVDVEVDVDGFDLLRGQVGEVRVSGANLTSDAVTVRSFELSVNRVGLDGRTFAALTGGLDGVNVGLADGSTLDIGHVALSGPSTAVVADVRLQPPAAEAIILAALAEAGLPVDRASLVEGGVEVELLGQRVIAPLAYKDGALLLPSVMGQDSVVVIGPSAGGAWSITGLRTLPTGLDIEVTIDAGAMLGGG